MEHRCEDRFDAVLVVTLHRPGWEPIRGTISNLSWSGAFVRLVPSHLALGGLVDLVLHMPNASNFERLWQAIIIHRQVDGVGLMFDDDQLAEVLPLVRPEQALARGHRHFPPSLDLPRGPSAHGVQT